MIYCMPGDEATETMRNDVRASLVRGYIRGVAGKALKVFDEAAGEKMRAKTPVIAVVVDAQFAADSILAFLQPLEEPSANVDRANVRENTIRNDGFFHAFFVLRIQTDL